jgi:dephospho-CoA kinase
LKLRNPDNWENQIKRLERQIPDSQKAALVDLIIENDASTDKLRKAARDLVEELG